MDLISFKKPVDLSGYTLIIPSVSVGNVPQLVTDLLITTLNLENVGTLWHPGLVASVGTDPFYCDNKIVCTACELYANEALKLAAIQFRSTVEAKLLVRFLNALKDSISKLQIKRIYILATGFDYELHNVANKNTLYYIATSDDIEETMKSMSAKQLEKDYNGKLIVSGSGFATKLYETFETHLDAILLVKYVSEGENPYDAQCLLKELLKCVEISTTSLCYPASWRYVYGPPPPLGLF